VKFQLVVNQLGTETDSALDFRECIMRGLLEYVI